LSKGADWPQASGGILAKQTHARLDQFVQVVPILLAGWQAGLAVWIERQAW
jgi:hypothetical protein